jgi:quinol monooxygenase YgiN
MIELRLYLQPPPQRTESLLAALQSLARVARVARGCLEARLFTESHDPRNLCYTEAWDTEENLCSMLCSEHFTRLAELMETAVEPPVLDFRTITAIRGLEFAQQARQGQNEGAFTLDSGDDSYP